MLNTKKKGSHIYFSFLLSFLSLFLLNGCGSMSTGEVVDPDEKPVSFLTGKTGGIKIGSFGRNKTPDSSLPVNALLWRAALDIASFVPLSDVDTFGGSIVTEWHQSQKIPDKKLKLAIFVVGQELRSDAIKVRAYTQKKQSGEWIDAGRDEALSRKIENLILARARELRSSLKTEIDE